MLDFTITKGVCLLGLLKDQTAIRSFRVIEYYINNISKLKRSQHHLKLRAKVFVTMESLLFALETPEPIIQRFLLLE